jgi:hypothetical protein
MLVEHERRIGDVVALSNANPPVDPHTEFHAPCHTTSSVQRS